MCARILARWRTRSRPSDFFDALQNRAGEYCELPVVVKFHGPENQDIIFQLPKDAPDMVKASDFQDARHLERFVLKKVKTPQETTPLSFETHIASCGKQVSKWLEICSESHNDCPTRKQPDWYPTRLLDLGEASANFACGFLKLIETRHALPKRPYITLSHCWGNATVTKLTRGSYSRFRRGIWLADLPKTFQDAATVADYLHVRYIWIDSLTIIQGNAEDWITESSAMARVYQNSLCNIGATASPDSHGGLFFTRQPELLLPGALEIGGQAFQLVPEYPWEDLEIQPLMKRAWVVQERWLCPRMIHFCHNQIYWECRMGIASEITSMTRYAHNMRLAAHCSRSSAVAEIASAWNQMVLYYSRGNLKFAKDKLVAFSGMARVMQNTLKDRYIVGLWEEDFLYHLLWMVSPEHKLANEELRCYRPDEYVAPTWSWASVNGPIWSWPTWEEKLAEDKRHHVTALISEIHVEYAGSDTFGQVKAGHVCLAGPLEQVTVHRNHELSNEDGQITARIWLDVSEDQAADNLPLVWICFYMLAYPDTPDRYHEAYGLLLRRTPGSKNQFQRAGMACAHFTPGHILYARSPEEQESDQHAERFIARQLHPRKKACLSDDFFDPDRGYTIKIV
ncbi:heterokaryon incompatibility protein-domain-containing protein [Ampelomyces quisqualis]|uniref:Heterokaryon incompatibility protein-domain-containing protein n=1 Tax=Ampelomyces quisqualis TaxID=50730 RepID=A0A6A5QSU8_AMPQU|nr:heterokaryon incompatibility protein-domain-containing protein [Ampelomyces quisqualis]